LSNKFTALDFSAAGSLIAEDGTVDASLSLPGSWVDAVITEESPNKESPSIGCPQGDVFSGADEFPGPPPILVVIAGIVSVI